MPGRGPYLVALLLALLGLGAGALLVLTQNGAIAGRVVRVVVPGDVVLALGEPGTWTVFHEPRSVLNGHLYQSPTVDGLVIRVTAAAGGPPLAIAIPPVASRFALHGHAGVAILQVRIPGPGLYRLHARYPDHRPGPEAVLAIAHGLVGAVFLLTLSGIGIGALGVGSGVALGTRTLLRRRASRDGLRLAGDVGAGAGEARTLVGTGVGVRAVATILDLPVLLVLLYLVAIVSGCATAGGFDLTGPPLLLGLLVLLAYYVLMEAWLGATLGKLLVGLWVVTGAGAPIGARRALVRTVLRIVDGLFFYVVAALLVWRSPRRQRLGDRVAGTLVVRREAGEGIRRRMEPAERAP